MSQRSGRGGGVNPVGTKSQVCPKKLLDGSPYAGRGGSNGPDFIVWNKSLPSDVGVIKEEDNIGMVVETEVTTKAISYLHIFNCPPTRPHLKNQLSEALS